MKFKEALESNPFAALAVTAIASASAGWGAHIAVLSQVKLDTVLQGTYVLKEDIDAGTSKLYTTRTSLERAQAEIAGLNSRIGALSALQAPSKDRGNEALSAALKSCEARESDLKVQAGRPKPEPQPQQCPQTILDNYYVDTRTGSYTVPTCLADGTLAASKLGATLSRNDNALRITGALGTPEGYFCSIGCYDTAIVVSCNSLSNQRSIGLTTRIRDHLSYK